MFILVSLAIILDLLLIKVTFLWLLVLLIAHLSLLMVHLLLLLSLEFGVLEEVNTAIVVLTAVDELVDITLLWLIQGREECFLLGHVLWYLLSVMVLWLLLLLLLWLETW